MSHKRILQCFRTLSILLALMALSHLGAATYTVTLSDGDRSVVVAVGDTVVVTSSLSGTARIYEACGTIGAPFPVKAGDSHVFSCGRPGRFSGTVSDPAGKLLGKLGVVVVSTSLSSKAIADQIGFARPVQVHIEPDGAPIQFSAADPAFLTVANVTVQGAFATMSITAIQRGTPVLEASIISPAGPVVIARRAVDEYTLDTTARTDTPIDTETGTGITRLEMRPFIPDLDVSLSMFAHTSTFAGGATRLDAPTNTWQRILDPVTHERIGVLLFTIVMPPGEDKFCFRGTVFQDDPVDTGETGNVNGHGCKITVDPISMCVVDTAGKDLTVTTISDTDEGDTKHAVIIVGGGKPADAYFKESGTATSKQTVQCTASGSTLILRVIPGTAGMIYDVKIGDTTFPKRITVCKITITTAPKNNRLLVKGKATLMATVSPAGESVSWSHPKALGFTPNGTPDATTTKIAAPLTPSEKDDTDVLQAAAALSSDESCIDTRKLTLTNPMHCTLISPAQNPIGGPVIARKTSVTLLNALAKYHIQDQFMKPIEKSEWGGAHVKVHEDTHFTSNYPAIQAWIKTIEVGGDSWLDINEDGTFQDQLELKKFPVTDFIIKGGFFDPTLKPNTVVLSLVKHVWKTSVDTELPQVITQNVLQVMITKVQPTELTLQVSYTFATQ